MPNKLLKKPLEKLIVRIQIKYYPSSIQNFRKFISQLKNFFSLWSYFPRIFKIDRTKRSFKPKNLDLLYNISYLNSISSKIHNKISFPSHANRKIKDYLNLNIY